jgi:hypothetical protein
MEWGTNKEQQLLSKALPVQAWRPKKVPFITGATMVDCSETHGLAATKDGRVFWWPHSAVHTQGASAEGAAHEVSVRRPYFDSLCQHDIVLKLERPTGLVCCTGRPVTGAQSACCLILLAHAQVSTLKGLRVLALAVGDNFAVVSTAPSSDDGKKEKEQQS